MYKSTLYLILKSPPLTRDVTCSTLHLDGKNIRMECQINNLQKINWLPTTAYALCLSICLKIMKSCRMDN